MVFKDFVGIAMQYKFASVLGKELVPASDEFMQYKAWEELSGLFGVKLVEALDTSPRLTLEEHERLETDILSDCRELAVYSQIILRFSDNPCEEAKDIPNFHRFPYTGVSYDTRTYTRSAAKRYRMRVKKLIESNAEVSCAAYHSFIAASMALNKCLVFIDDPVDIFQPNDVLVNGIIRSVAKEGGGDITPHIHVVRATDKKATEYFTKMNVIVTV